MYLDHAATVPLRDEVAEVTDEVRARPLGNPSSLHGSGRRARRLLDDARDEVAEVLGADPGGVVFTSGGTEANNLAVHGVAERRAGAVVCSAVEHDSVLEPVRYRGGRIVAVDAHGTVDLDDLADQLEAAAADGGVALVSVMLVNNENGVAQPLDAVAATVAEHAPGTPVHTDAVQGAAWLDLATATAAADLVTLTGHKIGAPVGTGALVLRGAPPLAAHLLGGGQEDERRSGTQNVVGAVGLARALSLAAAEREQAAMRAATLRDRFADAVTAALDDVVEPAGTGPSGRDRLVGGTVQLCFEGVESEALLFLLDQAGVEASAGSACAAGALEVSHVLTAMGVPDHLAAGALRISVGRDTTEADIDLAVAAVVDAVERLRGARAA